MSKEIISLNNNWKYLSNFKDEYINKNFDDSNFNKINLPHANKEVPYNYFDEKMYQFVSCYRNTFTIPKKYQNKLIFIDFEGVMCFAKVYINGKYLGEHKGGYTPFTFNLTDNIEFDSPNTLTVMVDSTERSDIPPFGHVVDYLTYGGIYREVNLRIVDKIFIKNVFAKPLNVMEDSKKLETDIYIGNYTDCESETQITVTLSHKDKLIAQCKKCITIGKKIQNKVRIVMEDIKDIQLWDLDNPNLYDLRAHIKNNFDDIYLTRIGFREAKLTEDGFYLNGKNVKIRGLNRHQAYPYVGYAMPERVQKKDADILKYELGLNTVRTSHYPQSKYFLDRCDEIGLLVLEEIPGWQHIGDKQWQAVACQNVKEMITRDWNHPSIFLWGVRINESQDNHDFYTETNKIAHELDNTRQTGGIRYLTKSELLEDVYTMNDFIHSGGEKVLRDQKEVTGLSKYVPYMVTEYNGHMYPTKRFDQEERLMEHTLRHLRVQNAAADDKHICGAIGWCAFDYNTHIDFGSGDRICYHGVMDMFRIPKFAAYSYKSQIGPHKEAVMQPVTLWTRGERSQGGFVPLVVLTNCDYIELYMDGNKLGKYSPDKEDFSSLAHPPVIIKQLPGEWGSMAYNGKFIGYVDDKPVIEKDFCKDPIPQKLEAKADDTILCADKIDAVRVVYKIVDQVGNICPFINEYIEFNITGPGEIIGPKKTALIGGCIAVWIKTQNVKGEITLSAKCSRFNSQDIKIKVK